MDESSFLSKSLKMFAGRKQSAGDQMTLDEYRELVRDVPRSTDDQIASFVDYVCAAHSWYKHLPLCLPGKMIYLFVNPTAGCTQVMGSSGQVSFREKGDESKFHYNEMATEDYRRRFGSLDFSLQAGSSFALNKGSELAVLDTTFPMVADRKGRLRKIPGEIAEAGSAEVTGVIHRFAARATDADRWLENLCRYETRWSEESGGENTLLELWIECRRLIKITVATDFDSPEFVNDRGTIISLRLKEILAPELSRQKQAMKGAVTRILDILYDNKSSDTGSPAVRVDS